MRNLPRPLLAAAALAAACLGVLTPAARAAPAGEPELVAGGLATPWEVVLLPDGRTWVTERDCRLRSVGEGGSLTTLLQGAPDVTCRKYLGLALHPGFAANGLAYLYETYEDAGARRSRIVRLVERDGTLERSRVVLDGIGSDLSHDGGRLAFGPDGRLYATTGDIHDPSRPQDLQSLNGKILRLEAPGDDRDGSAPADNPFAGLGGVAAFVWSYGHRHPQGLAWDALGRLWATEHGPSGEPHAPAGATASRDEINLIEPGENYGWPLVAGSQTREGTRPPAAMSGDTTTWAPGGAAAGPDGRLYVAMLFGRHVRSFDLDCPGLGAQRELFGGSGAPRLRTVTIGRGALWFTTDGERRPDGRPGGDRLMRVALEPGDRAPSACVPPVVVEPPAVEPPAVEPPAVEPPAVEPPAVEPPAVEPPAVEPPAVEPPAVEPPPAGPPAVVAPRPLRPHLPSLRPRPAPRIAT